MSGIIGGAGSKSGPIRKHRGINEPAFRIEGTTGQSWAGAAYSLIDWDTVRSDTAGYWVAGTNQYLPTDGVTRQFFIYCYVNFNTSDDFDEATLSIRKNDSQIFYSKGINRTSTTLYGYGVGELDGVDDYLTVKLYNPTGTSYTLESSATKCFFGGYALDITKPFA